MNTYLTSLLVDLLDPLAAAAGLGDSVQRARRHLTGADRGQRTGALSRPPRRPRHRHAGLRDHAGHRRHGARLADRAAAGSSTALRPRSRPSTATARPTASIAPGSRRATAISASIRAAIRTRPTSPSRCTCCSCCCRSSRRQAARCARRSRRHLDDDRIWVYYQRSPLVPILRTTRSRARRLPAELPASRMRTAFRASRSGCRSSVAGARTAAEATAGRGGGRPRCCASSPATTSRSCAQSPPLLYHNDLTATVPRYYWSEDVGYALWLRLAQSIKP